MCLINVYLKGCPEHRKKMYVILDEQSNLSLVRSAFYDIFSIQGAGSSYILKTCPSIIHTSGRRAMDFVIALDGAVFLALPTFIECNLTPNNKEEIPAPEVATHHHHLKAIAAKIPTLDPTAETLLLLGRDIIHVHQVCSHFNGLHNALI